MSSLRTDIISALWKGPKVAMLVIVESTLAEPRNANHCSSSTRWTGAIPKDALGNQYDFFPLAGVLGLRTIPAYPNELPQGSVFAAELTHEQPQGETWIRLAVM